MYIFCILSVQKAFKRILREEILHRMGFHKESEMFFFCLQPHKYRLQDYSATEEKKHTKYKHSYEQVFLCTTETADPVQWIEQLYNEDVS